jgi:hypothetical protein
LPAQLPANRPFQTADEAARDLQAWAQSQHFSTVRKEIVKSRSRQSWQQPYRLNIQCSRTATRDSKGTGERNKPSKGTNCPFRASIHRKGSPKLGFGNSWQIKMDNNSHNHNLGDLDGDATARRAQREAHDGDIEKVVQELSAITTITSRQIATYVSGSSDGFDDFEGGDFTPDPVAREAIQTTQRQLRKAKIYLTAQDIRNIQRALYAMKYNSHTTTKRLIELLDRHKKEHGIEYYVDWIDDEDGNGKRPKSIFWTYKWSLEMWRKNPEVLLMDNTYKVGLPRLFSLDFTLLLPLN